MRVKLETRDVPWWVFGLLILDAILFFGGWVLMTDAGWIKYQTDIEIPWWVGLAILALCVPVSLVLWMKGNLLEAAKREKELVRDRDEWQKAAGEAESLILHRCAQAEEMVKKLLQITKGLLSAASRMDGRTLLSPSGLMEIRAGDVLDIALELVREYKLNTDPIERSGIDPKFVLDVCRRRYEDRNINNLFGQDFADWVLGRSYEVDPQEGGAA